MTEHIHDSIADIVDRAEPFHLDEEFPHAPDVGGGDGFGGGGGDDGGGPPADGADGPDWELVRTCAAEPETDIGNARRFLHHHRERALFVQRIGWHVYDGRRWEEDVEEAHIRPLAHKVAEDITLETRFIAAEGRQEEILRKGDQAEIELARIAEAEEVDEGAKKRIAELKAIISAADQIAKMLKDQRSKRLRYAKTSGNKGKLDGMMNEAAPYVSRPVTMLDADPLAVNCENGTLRLHRPDDRTPWDVRLDAHRREDLISKIIPVAYDEDAEASIFENFIETVLPDTEIRQFVQRYLGYAMTAWTVEQVFVFFYGQGRNGKSTLVDIVSRIMGDYATTVPFETLAGDDRRKGADATPDLARLPGARLVRAAEPEQKMQFRESMVKSLTSGEPILVRRLHQDFVEIYPTFKLVVSGNHKPQITGTDDGIWRRVLLVPWEVQIPADQIDRALPERLWEERAGILNWLIRGTLLYLQDGLRIPDAVRAATDEYREESDPIGAFLREACNVTGDDVDFETSGSLYDAYKIFCAKAGFNAFAPTTFTRQLPMKAGKHGFRKAKTMGLAVYRGIAVKDEFRAPSHTHDGGQAHD